MKISDIQTRVNASYNTIKKFIESNPDYHEKIDNVLHATLLKHGIVEQVSIL